MVRKGLSSVGGRLASIPAGKRQGVPSRRDGAAGGLVILILATGAWLWIIQPHTAQASEPPALTSLSNPELEYAVPEKPYVILRRGAIEAVIVDNSAVDDEVLQGHRPGYNGVAVLRHERRRENLFVPGVAGLNYEFIHDGTVQPRDVIFEPRRAPMELRVIDEHTVELYQPPTPVWGLESCLRYHLLPDGTIEMTVEVIPRRPTFRHGYIVLFWASYIHQPQSLDIHFIGRAAGEDGPARWIRGVSPDHGVDSTHPAAGDDRVLEHEEGATPLIFSISPWRYDEPWYYGVSHGMAFVQIFRAADGIRISQSPRGGGGGNPAWDVQWVIDDYEVDRRYQMRMRAMYLPYESPQQLRDAVRPHLTELADR